MPYSISMMKESAKEAIESGLYETIQFPFSYLTGPKELAIVEMARANNVGFIAMKAMSGGLIGSSKAAYAYINSFDNVVPIWGVQRMSELDEFLSYMKDEPALDNELEEIIKNEREELQGDFCRGCGYCMPCPEIEECTECRQCVSRCPYELDIPELLKKNYEDYKKILSGEIKVD